MSNPYNDLIEIFREEGGHNNVSSFYFAKVTSSYPNLKVMFDDVEVEKDMLLIDSFLLARQSQIVTGSSEGHTHTLNTLTDLLKKGDRVILVRDNEKFIIISKVVSL